MTEWTHETVRHLLAYGAAMLGFDPPEQQPSAPRRTTDDAPSTDVTCTCPSIYKIINWREWENGLPPSLCLVHEQEDVLEFQEDLRLSLLREADEDPN